MTPTAADTGDTAMRASTWSDTALLPSARQTIRWSSSLDSTWQSMWIYSVPTSSPALTPTPWLQITGVDMVLERGDRGWEASTASNTLQGTLTSGGRLVVTPRKPRSTSYAMASKREEKATKLGLLKSIESIGDNSAMIKTFFFLFTLIQLFVLLIT